MTRTHARYARGFQFITLHSVLVSKTKTTGCFARAYPAAPKLPVSRFASNSLPAWIPAKAGIHVAVLSKYPSQTDGAIVASCKTQIVQPFLEQYSRAVASGVRQKCRYFSAPDMKEEDVTTASAVACIACMTHKVSGPPLCLPFWEGTYRLHSSRKRATNR